VSEHAAPGRDQAEHLLGLYDRALPAVYGYLLRRCGDATTAEDLTSEAFMAAVEAIQGERVPSLSVAWLVGVARHKLVDHWRRLAREDRKLALVDAPESVDEWEQEIDAVRARGVLAELSPQHRCVLTLRYLDGLPVRDIADHMGRTEHATEALLVRARASFRHVYGERGSDAG
jgi:RNA polymerase sigma-70 factor (ECF subfamily)